MATMIRPEISKDNKYWIDKHRHYELKHFCLQYPEWKKTYNGSPNISLSTTDEVSRNGAHSDPTFKEVIRRKRYLERIELIEQIAREADRDLHNYILKGVTEGLSYVNLKHKFGIPCSKDTYYDRYRRFFWLLDKTRD
jgi:hypothetical protein